MKIKRKHNTEIYEKIGNGFERMVAKTGKKIGLDKLGNKIVNWANQHKKATFGIIITFLTAGTLIIMIDSTIKIARPIKDFENPKIAFDSLSSQLQNPTKRLARQYDEYLFLKEYEDEMNQLLQKDTLTHEDSVRLIKIYDEIMDMEIQNYYNGKNQH